MALEPPATGALSIGGVAAGELADVYGTPLLALDTDVLDAKIAAFRDLGRRLGIDICYAAKALLFVALARRIADGGLGLDVCSLGELLTAEVAGVRPAVWCCTVAAKPTTSCEPRVRAGWAGWSSTTPRN